MRTRGAVENGAENGRADSGIGTGEVGAVREPCEPGFTCVASGPRRSPAQAPRAAGRRSTPPPAVEAGSVTGT